jgi:8-oxo-dGTP diphosphatase
MKQRFKLIPAVYVVFRDEDKVLLLRRANTGYHDGEYSLPAGHVDGGEPAAAAACREVHEEVGVTIQPADLKLVHTMHRISYTPEQNERMDLFFELTHWNGELVNAEPHKCDELRWAKFDDLPKNMVPEVRLALKKISAHEPYSDYNF